MNALFKPETFITKPILFSPIQERDNKVTVRGKRKKQEIRERRKERQQQRKGKKGKIKESADKSIFQIEKPNFGFAWRQATTNLSKR